ncbi:hypothetical protein L6164_032658 [Bauhinia variegata]|uniref:Uncharacterized protein n=1 Tax=Bauhinia variegata TaxID=167791 RepID=A0ACB9KPR3_BAUVA|nr:hypothetical protein L6164_032658 [Bauhinia variegata]
MRGTKHKCIQAKKKIPKFAIVLAVFAFHLVSTTWVSADLIDDVCQKTSDPNLCKSTIRLDPSSSSADTKGLARIMIQKTNDSTSDAKDEEIPRLIGKTKDVDVQNRLRSCGESYAIVQIRHVAYAMFYLDRDNYKAASNSIGEATVVIGFCNKGFTDPPVGPKMPSPLADVNKLLTSLIHVSVDILNMLAA